MTQAARTVQPGLQSSVRALLEQPILLEGVDGFREAMAWRMELRRFFERVAGWSVLTGPGALRLVAAPAFAEAGRAFSGLRSPQAAAFVAWTLWYHEYLGLRLGDAKQFSLSELSHQIETHSKCSMTSLDHRRALVQAVRSLEALGAMRLLDDETEDWENARGGIAGEHGGALLEFTSGAAYLISSPPEIPVVALQRAVRALLTGPAFHRSHDPEAFAALEHDAELEDGVLAELEMTLGWTLEVQREYALLLRSGQPRGLAKRWNPGRSVVEAAGLLLVNAVREEVGAERSSVDATGSVRVTRNRLYSLLDAVRATYRDRWGQQANLSTEKILREILEDWTLWGACKIDGEFVTLEPVLSRFEAFYFDPNKPMLERAAGRRRRRKSR